MNFKFPLTQRGRIPAGAGTGMAALVFIFFLLEYLLYSYVDRPLCLFMELRDSLSPGVINFFRTITDLGKAIWYLVPCGIVTLFCVFLSRGKDVPPAYRRLFGYIGTRTLFLFATIVLSGSVANILKPLIGRARPHVWLQDGVYGFEPLTRLGALWNGMPSGHTTTAFALACSLSLFYPRMRILWFAYALILGASRVAVNAHFLSDVVAGATLGWLTTYLFYHHGMLRLWKVIFPIDKPPETR